MLNTNRPTTRPWLVTTVITEPQMIGERNPFFYGIDRAGNQLPYIDRLVFELVLDRELIVLKGVAGEIDMQGRHIQFNNFPVLQEGEEKGNYTVRKYGTLGSIPASLKFNLTYDGPEREYITNKDFRIALSHAINRDEINEIIFFGLGEKRNFVAPRDHSTYPGDKLAQLYTEYDPDKANAMLDALGLDKRDSDGFRLMANGDRLNLEITTYKSADNNELIANYWNAVGVHTGVDLVARALCGTQKNANKNMISAENAPTLSQFANPGYISPWHAGDCHAFGGNEYAIWRITGGKEGREPTAEIKALMKLVTDGRAGTAEDRDRLGKEIGRMHAENQWVISPVAEVPVPFIVSNRLGNVAEVARSAWLLRTPANTFPEVFFFRD